MRGNSASPLCTVLPGFTPPKVLMDAQVLNSSSVTPICAKMRSGVRGMVGAMSTPTMRAHSSST